MKEREKPEKDELQELATKIAVLKNPHVYNLRGYGIDQEEIEKALAEAMNRMEKLLNERERKPTEI